MDVGQVRQRRLSDDIVERLETMILEGALKAGERLPAERVLAERLAGEGVDARQNAGGVAEEELELHAG